MGRTVLDLRYAAKEGHVVRGFPYGSPTLRGDSWNAHLAHGDTWRLRQQIFADLDLPYPLE